MRVEINHILSYLPYFTSSSLNYLKVNVQDLSRLTLLVGPNSSGKTTILELIGLTLLPLLDIEKIGLGASLINMLRPLEKAPRVPDYIFSRARTDDHGEIASIYIKIEPDNMEKVFNTVKILEKLYNEDIEDIKNVIIEVLPYLREAPKLIKLIRKFFENSEIEIYSKFLRKGFIPKRGEKMVTSTNDPLLEKIFETYPYKLLSEHLDYIVLTFTLFNNKLHKMLIIRGPDTVIVKDKHEHHNSISIVVFHPIINHIRGIVEELYRTYVLTGQPLPNEDRAIEILSNYVKGLEGFEIIDVGKRHELHVKVNGRRISIYKLSDGYRLAVTLSLLYALAHPHSMFLIDTPEAFVHPDGIPTVSEIISELAVQSSQTVVATQSIELIRELLKRVYGRKISDILTVKRVSIEDSTVRDVGSWRGDAAYSSVINLEVDLRI
ncbi:MAG: ATP-binding protein [Crenarchaeota archaeon]|nr:ATP-binding protein [Thermoproteota archaeon]